MKVALYARVSSLDQDPLRQEKQLIEKAEKEGWKYTLYNEKKSTRKSRPVKYSLYQELLKKEYDAVVVTRLTRWARTLNELVREVPILYDKGVKFISLHENIDLTTASGKLQFHMFCAFAEFERDLISERTKEAFYVDEEGVTRSIKSGKAVGKRKKDKSTTKRRKSSYYKGWMTRRENKV